MANFYLPTMTTQSAAISPQIAFQRNTENSFKFGSQKVCRSFVVSKCCWNNGVRKKVNLNRSVNGIVNSREALTSLMFQNNIRSKGHFGSKSGNCFSFNLPEDTQTVGFQWKHENSINSVEGYYGQESALLYISEAYGGVGENMWDDGAYDTVRKIYIGEGIAGIHYLKFEYDKNGKMLTGKEHGKMTMLGIEEFELDHPNEYLISMEGYYDNVVGSETPVIQSIKFRTNKRSSQAFGYECGTYFSLEERRRKITGFHGRASDVLNALGAYFEPICTVSSSSNKLEAYGGEGGDTWDDGVYEAIRKIHVGLGKDGIHYIMFEYDENGQVMIGKDHGEKTILGIEEFELNYPNEYLTSVEGYYDNICGFDTPIIQSLTFKTNKKTSQPFGFEVGTRFELGGNGRNIIGFHGRAGKVLHKIGAYVKETENQ